MNLLQVRHQFRELSGRFDLVNEDGSDNGADFFINEGRKFLDRLDETAKSWASCFQFVDVGRFSATFPHCRAIKEVWAMSSQGRWQLEKKGLQDLIEAYLKGLPSSRGVGIPLYYSPSLTRHIPDELETESFESFIGWVDIPSGNVHEYNALLLNVPVSETIALDIKGLFYSSELLNDEDRNYWTTNHPLLLIMAAMRYIEVTNRNTQGVNDWSNSIATEAKQIGMDLVEQHIAEVSQMGG